MPARVHVAVLVMMTAACLARSAAADAAGRPQPRVATPGVYVVSSCHIFGYGTTEAEARRAFTKAVREARRGWPTMGRRCALLRLTDIVRIVPGHKPAFFVAGSRLVKGEDRQEVVGRCRAAEEAQRKAEPDVIGPDPRSCDRVRAAYGPFTRKPAWDELDDARRYVFLDDEGSWIDDTGDPICFPAGTAVATPEGDRPIETLAAGSRVLSWSVQDGATVAARVLDVKRRRAHELMELTLADGRALRVSANHPLFVPARGEWVAAGELRAGDRLAALADGRLTPVTIAQIATRAVDVDVYDLTIEATHTYFAGGVLAHNY